MVEVDKIAKIVRVIASDSKIESSLSFERVNGTWEAWLGQNFVTLSDHELGELIDGLQKLRKG